MGAMSVVQLVEHDAASHGPSGACMPSALDKSEDVINKIRKCFGGDTICCSDMVFGALEEMEDHFSSRTR